MEYLHGNMHVFVLSFKIYVKYKSMHILRYFSI